jgi:hypothetical protein
MVEPITPQSAGRTTSARSRGRGDDPDSDDKNEHIGSRRRRDLVIPGRISNYDRSPPHIPNEDYQLVEKEEIHEYKHRALGIKDALLGPRPPARRPWFRGMHELYGYKPVRQGFTEKWPDKEMRDDWYEIHWLNLRERTQNFAAKYFKFGDRELFGAENHETGESDKGDISDPNHFLASVNSLWLEGTSPQFIYYAKQVARQDNKTGGWEALLQKEKCRPLLVQGIIGRVLQMSVFTKLLFGCTEDEEIFLRKHDEVTITSDGKSKGAGYPLIPAPDFRTSPLI